MSYRSSDGKYILKNNGHVYELLKGGGFVRRRDIELQNQARVAEIGKKKNEINAT